jgi:membrane-associated protease RseP (regulator of RpoE activity)
MSDIDVGLFEFDRNNALYYFIMNADDTIYMRYGGRDERSAESYLSLDSIELALKQGLEQHALYQEEMLPNQERPEPLFPCDIPRVRRELITYGRCVECHLIGDYTLLELERSGTLDKITHMYKSPDIRTIGIHLDVPKGLVVKEAEGAVVEAGMKPGDRIVALNGQSLLTFGDFQFWYDKVPRDASHVALSVERGGQSVDLEVALPKEWWLTDLYFRNLTVNPQQYFTARTLTPEEKAEYGFALDGFASEVVDTDPGAVVWSLHRLEKGDIIKSVNGVESDPDTDNLELYIKLYTVSGKDYTLVVVRGGEEFEMLARTKRQSFRRPTK